MTQRGDLKDNAEVKTEAIRGQSKQNRSSLLRQECSKQTVFKIQIFKALEKMRSPGSDFKQRHRECAGVYAYMVCMCVCECACARVCVCQRTISGIPCFLRQALSLAWSSSGKLGWLAREPQGFMYLPLENSGFTRIPTIPKFCLLIVFETGFSLCSLGWQNSHLSQKSIYLCLLTAGIKVCINRHSSYSSFLCGFWESNSSPHACTSVPKPSPSLQMLYFKYSKNILTCFIVPS